jgi:protein gp37
MAEKTNISWCSATFSPWHGCTKVSDGCDFCYAATFSRRLGYSEKTADPSKFPIWGKDAQRRFFGGKHWAEPLKWNTAAEREGIRRRVFCGSMCDVMEDRRDLDEWRWKLCGLIADTPWLDWLLLTKRPQNFLRFLPKDWLAVPQSNVWLMTSVESPAFLWRVDTLKACPAVVHGLSVEPLIEPLPTLGEYLDGISWAIVGGESGAGARPMDIEWARSIRDQCANAGTAYFCKQLGGVRHKRDQLEDLPPDLRVRQFPIPELSIQ